MVLGPAPVDFFSEDFKEKWDIMTSKCKKTNLDKFFSSKVECTGIPLYDG